MENPGCFRHNFRASADRVNGMHLRLHERPGGGGGHRSLSAHFRPPSNLIQLLLSRVPPTFKVIPYIMAAL